MNSFRGKSRIMLFYGSFILTERIHLAWCQDEGSFWAHAPYLGEAFDGGTKATQLAEAKLGSEGLGTGQEDAEADTLKEYAIVLPFKLL